MNQNWWQSILLTEQQLWKLWFWQYRFRWISCCCAFSFSLSPGDVHVGMVDRGGQLEVEINQARGLTPKPGSKNIPGTLNWRKPSAFKTSSVQSVGPHRSFTVWSFVPLFAATYVKVYVLENGVCLAKKKTKVVKKNLDPTYQQALLFDESPQGKVLQVCDLF